jgi:hypothetical protein
MKFRRTVVAVCTAALLASGTGTGSAATYGQPVSFDWDRMVLDVLIVPPQHGQIFNGPSNTRLLNGNDPKELNPLSTSYLKATEKSIVDWKRAIKTFGSARLKRLRLNVFVLGRDIPTQAALTNPEIIIAWDEHKGTILGQSVRFWTDDYSTPCLNHNSQFYTNSFSYPDMYNVAGHEFGHCLGLDHSTPAKSDIMYAQYTETIGLQNTRLHCMSNLNVKGLEFVYDGKTKPRGATVKKYQRISC